MLDNSDMDFLGKSGKSGSAKEDIKFLPDQFNGVGHLQSECEHNLLSHDTAHWSRLFLISLVAVMNLLTLLQVLAITTVLMKAI